MDPQIRDRRWVVLDDDPTGVQTVHDLPVYTGWSVEILRQAFQAGDPMFYILTNSRGLQVEETTALHRELMDNLFAAAEAEKVGFSVISRSDSTLRGHFPLETDLINEAYVKHTGRTADGVILAPFFLAGGRFTIDNIHYVKQGDQLVPAAETEFAKDATFGYTHSDLREYVEEKTKGRFKAADVLCVPLELLKQEKIPETADILRKAEGGVPIVVNATDPKDLDVFVTALEQVLGEGKCFLYRTAADFVRAAGHIGPKQLLSAADMKTSGKGGVVVVGSHTQKTTDQLEALKEVEGLTFIPFDSDRVLDDTLAEETRRVAQLVDQEIAGGRTAVFFTKRTELKLAGDTKAQALARSVKISDAVTAVIASLKETPGFIVAKGGITSSDVGVKALKVRKAWVLGQIQPGIPVWKCGEESRFPGVPYIIFPGNVGSEDTLKKVVATLKG